MNSATDHSLSLATKARLPAGLFCVLALFGCTDPVEPPQKRLAPVIIGRLEDPAIHEASGLARSQIADNVLWTINDNGAKEWVHALSPRGTRLGEFKLKKSKNRDWEDLASFVLDGTPYLLVADIGDNDAQHKRGKLYVVEEPAVEKRGEAKVTWQIDFRYPDGPRDAESVAVDIDNRRVLVLSKRDIPPVLYEVPLVPDDVKVTATWLGTVRSLPPPSRQDVEFAPKTKNWHWQPTGMDISADGLAAVILTYRAVYYYERQPGQDWFDAFNLRPRRVSIGNFRNAEAIAFADVRRSVVVTGENRHSPLLLINFDEKTDNEATP